MRPGLLAPVVVTCLVLGGCFGAESVVCGDITCPAGSRCGPANECVPADCGDKLVTGLETCDSNAGTLKCSDFGFYGGPPLTCSATRQIDTSMCLGSCGDQEVNGPERCDGIPPAGFSCADFGFDLGALTCATGCTPGFELCSSVGWQTAPGGAMDELRAIWLAGPAAGVAVGLSGTIVMSVDGVWVPVQSPTTADLYGVWGVAPNKVFAVGADGVILQYDGTTWKQVASPTTNTLFAISGVGTEAVAVGANGTIIHHDGTGWSADSSSTSEDLHGVFVGALQAVAVGANNTVVRRGALNNWSVVPLSTPSPAVTLRAVYAAGTEVFVAGDDLTALRITGGTSATQLTLPQPLVSGVPVTSVWASAANDVFFAGGNGYMFHWNGTRVVLQNTQTLRTIYGLVGTSAERVFGVTRGGGVLVFNGTDSRVEVPFPSSNMYAVFKEGKSVVAVGDNEALHFDGTTWTQQTVNASAPTLESVWASGADVWTGCGRSGAAAGMYFSDNGGAFTKVTNAGINSIFGLSSPLQLVAVGDTVQLSSNGTTWTPDATAVNGSRTLRGVWAAPDGTWFAVGDAGFAMKKTATVPWTDISTPTTQALLAVWGTSATDVFAVGAKGTLMHWNGTRWRPNYVGTGENLFAIDGNSHSDIYVIGTSIRFHFDGISWSRMTGAGRAVATTGAETIVVGPSGVFEWFTRTPVDKETRCADPWDNDGKDGTNCDDPKCVDDIACRVGGACPTLTRVSCATSELEGSTYSGIARIDDLPCLDHSTPGPEGSYRFIADRPGLVTVTVADPSGNLDMVVTEANGGACKLDTCTAATRGDGTLSVTFDATLAAMYYIVIDGPLYTAETFTLNVTCSAP